MAHESADLTEAVDWLSSAIAYGLQQLGNGGAATPMGAIEAHGKCILDAADKIASALERLAEAVEQLPSKRK